MPNKFPDNVVVISGKSTSGKDKLISQGINPNYTLDVKKMYKGGNVYIMDQLIYITKELLNKYDFIDILINDGDCMNDSDFTDFIDFASSIKNGRVVFYMTVSDIYNIMFNIEKK